MLKIWVYILLLAGLCVAAKPNSCLSIHWQIV